MNSRRKSESSEGDDRPRKRQDKGTYLACPYYKRDPTQHMHCLYRNQLTSTSFVRQHIQRYHDREKKSPARRMCHNSVDGAVEPGDHPHQQTRCSSDLTGEGSKDGRESLCHCEDSRSYRRATESVRWYHIWDTIFPGERRPESPYVGSPEDEILRMILKAMKRISPHGSPPELQNLDSWSAVSSILQDGNSEQWLNQTPSEAGSISSGSTSTPPEPALVTFQPLDFQLSNVLDPSTFYFSGNMLNEESLAAAEAIPNYDYPTLGQLLPGLGFDSFGPGTIEI